MLALPAQYRTGRQWKPGKRGSIPKNAPPILDRLNLSAELSLHAVEQFAKLRSANRIAPASGFNATAKLSLTSAAVQRAEKGSGAIRLSELPL